MLLHGVSEGLPWRLGVGWTSSDSKIVGFDLFLSGTCSEPAKVVSQLPFAPDFGTDLAVTLVAITLGNPLVAALGRILMCAACSLFL